MCPDCAHLQGGILYHIATYVELWYNSSMGKNVECLDPETGEFLGLGNLLPAKKPRRQAYRKGFCMFSNEQLGALSLDKELFGVDLRILMHVSSKMGYQNRARVNQKAIAESLGFDRPQVSRSCKKLVEKGLLDFVSYGKNKLYAVSRRVAFKGRAGVSDE